MDFKRKRYYLSALCFLGTLCFFSMIAACSDFGLEADFFPGTVSGNIIIDERIPPKTDEIQIFMMRSFPPTSTDELLEASRARVTALNRSVSTQSVPFEIVADSLSEFSAIIAVWKRVTDADQAGDLDPFLNTVGAYCNAQDEFIKIELSEQNRTIRGIQLPVDLKKVNRTSRVSGTIDFTGDWPQQLDRLAIVFLDANNPDVSLCNLPEIRELPSSQVNSLNFNYPVSAGPKVIFVVWIPANASSLFDFNLIAISSALPTDDTPATGINISAAF